MTTDQDVSSHIDLAMHLRRLLAFMLDFVLIMLVVFFIFYFVSEDFLANITFVFDQTHTKNAPVRLIDWATHMSAVSFNIYVIYCIFMEASPCHATLGKKIMDLSVIKADGTPFELKDSIKRNLFKFVSSTLLYLGFIWGFFQNRKQTWHDLFAKTLVVQSGSKS